MTSTKPETKSKATPLQVEKATIADVPQLHAILGHFAAKGDLLPRTLAELYENVRDFYLIRENGKVIACGALHVLWSDLAEVKSLAVTEGYQARGLGAQIVRALLEEAKRLELDRVFALTYKPGFFATLGFRQVDIMTLPHKVFGECVRCPKFHCCDEIAVIKYLNSDASPAPKST
ncbi:MAG: N-acetyltransferase [Chloroflexi bacterium]|nr:N-acetyltransferase [Chloroflexota bacterium]